MLARGGIVDRCGEGFADKIRAVAIDRAAVVAADKSYSGHGEHRCGSSEVLLTSILLTSGHGWLGALSGPRCPGRLGLEDTSSRVRFVVIDRGANGCGDAVVDPDRRPQSVDILRPVVVATGERGGRCKKNGGGGKSDVSHLKYSWFVRASWTPKLSMGRVRGCKCGLGAWWRALGPPSFRRLKQESDLTWEDREPPNALNSLLQTNWRAYRGG